jgi:hypothetical protein
MLLAAHCEIWRAMEGCASSRTLSASVLMVGREADPPRAAKPHNVAHHCVLSAPAGGQEAAPPSAAAATLRHQPLGLMSRQSQKRAGTARRMPYARFQPSSRIHRVKQPADTAAELEGHHSSFPPQGKAHYANSEHSPLRRVPPLERVTQLDRGVQPRQRPTSLKEPKRTPTDRAIIPGRPLSGASRGARGHKGRQKSILEIAQQNTIAGYVLSFAYATSHVTSSGRAPRRRPSSRWRRRG